MIPVNEVSICYRLLIKEGARKDTGRTMLCTKLSFILSCPEFQRDPSTKCHTSPRVWVVLGIDQSRAIPEVHAISDMKERTARMTSVVFSSPPCIHRNCLFMTAASGRVQNDSMHAS